jgi:hypothetical protein
MPDLDVETVTVTSGAFDRVVDFASATADPADPLVFNPAFDSGDHLHPTTPATRRWPTR